MTAPGTLTTWMALGLASALCSCLAQALDPWPEPRPIAADQPAFRAPEEPPEANFEEPVASEPAGPLGLRDALALALIGNPDLAAFSWEARASEARTLQAGKSPNPEIELRLQTLDTPATVPDESRRRVMVSQVVELGGKLNRRVGLAQAERQLAGWDYEAQRIEVATQVTSEFVAVLGAQRRADSWRRFVEFLDQTRARVAALVASGFGGAVEGHRVSRRLGLARIDLQRAESELGAARFQLAATWGSPSPRFTEAVGDLDPVGPIPELDTVIDLARQSPALARGDAEQSLGHAALALARAERVPDLTVGAGVRWEDSTRERGYLVDFQIELPILDRNQGGVREARYRLAEAQARRRAAAAEAGAAIADAYYALIASRARARTLGDEVVPAARVMFEAHRAAFESQTRGGADDLLDAAGDLARAEADHAEALVDSRRALAALEGLVGQSLEQR